MYIDLLQGITYSVLVRKSKINYYTKKFYFRLSNALFRESNEFWFIMFLLATFTSGWVHNHMTKGEQFSKVRKFHEQFPHWTRHNGGSQAKQRTEVHKKIMAELNKKPSHNH